MTEQIAVAFPHKIVVPQRPEYLVARPRLREPLDDIRTRRLVTLTAPPGYGKTSLLIDFASTIGALPLCWYTLDRFDIDPWSFLSYLAAAIARRFPAAFEHTAAALASRARIPFATAAAALTRDIYAIDQSFVLVIDDWHLVDEVADITETLAQVLLHCANCHVILASRSHPGLPDLMLMAARRQMSGLDSEALRFTAPEIAEVLSAESHAPIAPALANQLAEQSNGWIAGVLLAVHAAGPAHSALALPAMGAERQIYSFLSEQVFERQPPEARSFMLESALIDELTAERCDLLLRRRDSASQLGALLRHHVFIAEVKPGVLRYHPLFREFLLDQFRAHDLAGYRAIARRLAEAYAGQAQWSLAFDTFIAAEDFAGAQRVAEAGGPQLLTGGRLETLEHWFALLPLAQLSPALLCLKARLLLDRGRPHEAQALADLAGASTPPGEQIGVMLVQSQIARVTGSYEQALAIAQAVLARDPDPAQRASALRTTAICHHRLGQTEAAIAEIELALAIERQRGDLYATALLQFDLGVCFEATGQLRRAEEFYALADAYWATIGNAGLRAVSANSRGVVQHLAGRYRDAHATFATAIEYARLGHVPQYQATALASLGDLYSDLQLWSRADGAYRQAREVGGTAFVKSYLELAAVRQLVRQHHYAGAAYALQQLPAETLARHAPMAQLLRSRIACGQGDYAQAYQLASQAAAAAEQNQAPLDQARAYLYAAQALAAPASGELQRIRELLDQACRVAEQLGHNAALAAELAHLPELGRSEALAGWAHADEWRARMRELQLCAQQINSGDERPVISVQTLGAERLLLDGQPVELGWQKARELFYYLLAHPTGASSEQLRAAIWPDLDDERGRGALKSAVFRLRAELPRDLIALRGRQIYYINEAVAQIEYDAQQFLELAATPAGPSQGGQLLAALDLYRGPFLPWSEQAWAREQRAHLEQRLLAALRGAASATETRGDPAEALRLYERILAIDTYDEAAHTGVMRSQVALGNRAAAIEQYHALRRILDEELGLSPDQSSEAARLYLSLLRA